MVEFKMTDISKRIAHDIFPESWVIDGEFRHDRNASKRAVAEEVAEIFINALRSESVANEVMLAFVRRSAGSEPNQEDVSLLTCYMATALMAIDKHLAK